MMKNFIRSVMLLAPLASYSVFADNYGTAEEAKALLEKVVTSLKTDESATIDKINKGEGGFKDRDLYPFCVKADGSLTAHPVFHPNLDERNLKAERDIMGKAFGEEMIKNAKEGQISKVTYMWPRPGETKPVQKTAFITKVGDHVCGVGYYKK
ncbi:cache domain-containing protein [Microbulbifer sp. THAF38]|uniref:cache domain-containing protein n=1 Tax=Microbulbifer sp. THAF38 TaxID=2587856 RepID=UPI0012A8310F|nr:cache domain-containing protein [Microbulbifer sp. THAF38]QFT54820.1 hypothetical protein FIU95_09665 [Microbulbifer sp. THAF38]